MREEEAIVGDEEGRTEETPSSSTIPPDHLRCHRHKGQRSQCKSWKFHPSVSVYCELHYNQRRKYKEKEKEKKKVTTTTDHHHQVIEKKLAPWEKIRRYTDFIVFSSTDDNVEEDDNFIPTKKTRISTKTCETKEMDKFNFSELITYLKSCFQKQEFENVDKILQMMEDKVKMEKQEAEKQELGILGATCEQLTSEVEEKEKEIFELNDTLLEMEIKNSNIQDDLEAKVGRLEKELEIVRERERRSEERFTKMSWDLRERISELERKDRDLETEKRRDEGGIDVWKKRLDQTETQVLMEPQASRKIYAEPRGSQSNVYCLEEGRNHKNEKWRIEGVTDSPRNHACLSNDNIEKEATVHDRRFYASANSDSENRVTQLAGVPKGSESKQIKFQSEATHVMKGATLSQIKIKEEALNCDERFYTSASGGSVHHSIRVENTSKSTPSKERLTSLQQSKESESAQTKFQSKASCALSGVKLSQVKIKEEPLNCDGRFSASASVDSAGHSIGGDDVKDASISRSSSILLQQFEQKRSAAEQILPNQFEVIGTSCKQSRNSTAEDDSAKDTKELGADCDGISAFLCDLRRLKANKPN